MASQPNGRPDDELESTIRRCVREEMRSFRGCAQSCMDWTQHLIQEATTVAARKIETNMNVAGVNRVPNGEICPGLTLIRCTRISISVTKCPLALLANFNITCVSECRQFMSQSVPQMLLFK